VSIRSRLTLAYVGFFAIALLALDLGLYFFMRASLIGSIDNELRLGATLLQQGFTESNTTLRGHFQGDDFMVALTPPSVSGFDETSLYVQIHQNDGTLVTKSPNMRSAIAVPGELLASAREGQSIVSNATIGHDYHVRQLVAPLLLRNPVTNKDETAGVMVLSRRMDETDRALSLFAYTLLGGGLVVLLAAARGGTWLTRAAFRPIDEVVLTAQSIVSASDLSSRVQVPDVEDELQRLTITINDLLARLEQLFATQRRFVADVSHELRTPLAAMQGNLDVLARGADRDPALLRESLDDMRREVSRLIRMTNDLLLLAQSEAGLQLHHDPVELDTLLLEVLRELRPLAGNVQLRLGAEDQALVEGDRDRIKQALLNLGMNAIQHTPAGGSVTLGLERLSNWVRLSVQDTGSGIAPEILPHIFDRFYRADVSRNRNYGGAGLGLAIVKWIADAHGGEVLVESQPGQGSTFILALPLLGGAEAQGRANVAAAPAPPVADMVSR
jgi:heavy metal sensor kinase